MMCGPIHVQNELLSFIVLATKYHIDGSYWSRLSPNIAVFKTILSKYEAYQYMTWMMSSCATNCITTSACGTSSSCCILTCPV